MNGKTLVTAANGNVGSSLVKILKRAGVEFSAGVRNAHNANQLISQGIDCCELDFSLPETLEKSMQGVSKLYLILPLHEKMVEWASATIEAAKNAKVEYIVRQSGLGAGEENYSLGSLQNQIDQMVINSNVNYSILRPNSFMQNYSVFYAQIIRQVSAIMLPNGDSSISLIDARDVAMCAAALLGRPERHSGKIYDLTGPHALTNQEIAASISEVTGKSIMYIPIGEDTARTGMESYGVSNWMIDVMLSLNEYIKSGKAALINSTVHELIGHDPNTFQAFAKDFAKSWL